MARIDDEAGAAILDESGDEIYDEAGDTASGNIFMTFVLLPTSKKIFLAEIEPAQELITFALTDGQTYTYEKSFLNESITLANGKTLSIRKEISRVTQNGVSLSLRDSIANVEATAGTYWHDTANGILYVHSTANDDPNDYTLIGYFWLRFATEGIILNHKYYEPYISEDGIPSINQSTSEVFWGVMSLSAGDLILLNGTAYFDNIARAFLWLNKKVRVLIGGDDLPYDQYRAIYTGIIANTEFSADKFELRIESTLTLLEKISLPINSFWTDNYPNLDPSAEGLPIPYYYGVYSESQAPVVTCVNTAYAADTYQFKICDHAILSIAQVYVDYGDGAGWQTITHANEDLFNAVFTIVSADFVLGTSRIKVAFSGKYSGAAVIDGAPEIIEDILLSFCDKEAEDLNEASFTASKAESAMELNVDIASVQTALSIFEKIASSDIGLLDEDEAGLIRYRTWHPEYSGTIPVITEDDILSTPQIASPVEQVYFQVSVGHSTMHETGEQSFAKQSNAATYYKYGIKESLQIDSYIRGFADADLLAQRLLFLLNAESPRISFTIKIQHIDKLVGSKIKLTLPRAPFAAGGYDERLFEIVEKTVSCYPVETQFVAKDMLDYGKNIGFWMSATAPDWDVATDQEKQVSGFWADADGYAEAGDETSKNVSRWW